MGVAEITLIPHNFKELGEAMFGLPDRVKKTLLRRALRKAGRSVKMAILQNITGRYVNVGTGHMLHAFASQSMKPTTHRHSVVMGISHPTRAELMIATGELHGFYPNTLEYGTRGPRYRGNRKTKGIPIFEAQRTMINFKLAGGKKAYRRRVMSGIFTGEVDERAFIRNAIDDRAPMLVSQITSDLRADIPKAWAAATKKMFPGGMGHNLAALRY